MSAVALPSAPALVAPLSVPVHLPARRYGRRLRLKSLSPASLRAFEKCPEAFRRQYLLGEKVPPNLSMTLGSVVGDTLAHYFAGRIAGRPPAARRPRRPRARALRREDHRNRARSRR